MKSNVNFVLKGWNFWLGLTLRTIICLGVAATQLYDGSFFYSSGWHPRLEAFAAGRLLVIIKSREAAKAISLRCQPQAKKWRS
jgi:hypothetical protein